MPVAMDNESWENWAVYRVAGELFAIQKTTCRRIYRTAVQDDSGKFVAYPENADVVHDSNQARTLLLDAIEEFFAS